MESLDIEEVAQEVDNPREPTLNILSTKTKKKENHKNQQSQEAEDEGEGTDKKQKNENVIPGTQKIWLKTYGCSHNISDSEYMQGLLVKYGYELVNNSEEADAWVVNSCTVKDPSQAAFMHVVKQAKEKKKPIVVAGCVSQADRSLNGLEDVSVIGITQIDRIVEAVEQTIQGNVIKMLAKKTLPLLDLPKVRKNPLVEIIPLSTGCLGACTYCKTKQARGKLGSYSIDTIVHRTKQVILEGVSEIWLSSEDTGAYGRDIGTNIGILLDELIAVLPSIGNVMLRIGMTNPPYILEHLAKIAQILNHPHVYAFLHVPVQAGSNAVLTAMNREYSIEEFKQVADYLLEHVPGMTLATDIICGFPNETEEDFQETLALIDHYQLAIVNISQFYPRPGTPAAKMKRIPTQIVKDRSRRLTKLFESFTPYEELVGQTVKVWFDIEISDDKRHAVGHTKAYVKVLVPYQDGLPGSCYLVNIQARQRFHIEGELVSLVHVSNLQEQQSRSPVSPATGAVSSSSKESHRGHDHSHDHGDHGDHQCSSHHNITSTIAKEDDEFEEEHYEKQRALAEEQEEQTVDGDEALQITKGKKKQGQQLLLCSTIVSVMWLMALFQSSS